MESEISRTIFSGMQIFIGQKWVKNQAVVIENGVIKAIVPSAMVKHHLPAKKQTFPHNFYLIPGLMDLHIHGTHNHDVMDGSVESLILISRMLVQEGVTGFLATTMTTSNCHLKAVLKTVPLAAKATDKEGADILGVHLEGPFLSKHKMGAQCADHVQLPDLKLFNEWQDIAEGMIKLVTLAPELPDALSVISTLRKMGVLVSAGHTNATYAEMNAAIQAGCSHATHLFNAMRGLHQREPGAVGALLLSPDVTAELIVDGLHVHPAIVELALRLKGKDRLLLVTDAMRAKCCPDGQYELGGQAVTVRGEKATLENGTLAGSVLRLPQAIKNIVQFTQCELEDVIVMATFNPARELGLLDRKGSIAVGKDADLVVLSDSLEVMLTMKGGREVYNFEYT